ncbi:MAG: hypothetical protein N3G20_10850 [Verrucomicrobiae bacterium]|nr:hypothetical protein [Verrucomicrobiae bacterium]
MLIGSNIFSTRVVFYLDAEQIAWRELWPSGYLVGYKDVLWRLVPRAIACQSEPS